LSIIIKQTNDGRFFQTLENKIYATDPFHIPVKEPAPTQGTSFIALDDGEPIACCHAQLQTGNPTVGTIGRFQALENPAAVKQLLASAIQWLEKQGAHRILAPMDGDTWHTYRFNTGSFDQAPFIKEPWNPPYYPSMIENTGFSVVETYDSYIINDPALAAANQEKFYTRCVKNGYLFEPITTKNYARMLPLIYELSCRIFAENTLYTAVSREEFLRMYAPAKPLLKTGLSWMAYASDRTPAGYVFTFPDYATALRAMQGKNDLPAKIRFLMNKRKATRSCIKTLGTIPEKRGSGLTAALTYLSYKNSAEQRFKQTLMCLMHSSNDSRSFGGKADRPFRSYALYEYRK
jgi:hypothetical protein